MRGLKLIDLPPESQGSDCVLCDVWGASRPAKLYHHDVGPCCHECFAHALQADSQVSLQDASPDYLRESKGEPMRKLTKSKGCPACGRRKRPRKSRQPARQLTFEERRLREDEAREIFRIWRSELRSRGEF